MSQGKDSTRSGGWKHLSEKERYKIEALYGKGHTASEIGKELGRDRRTIEREIKRGLTKQLNSDLTTRETYYADEGQREHEERAGNKGRGLKIGDDHKPAQYIERKIKEEKWSPDAVIGSIEAQGLKFETRICTKTLYSYIDKGIFAGISNKDLWVKKKGKKRTYRKVRTVALNNRDGKSISERPKEVDEREEQGHWEIDLVVGKQGSNTNPIESANSVCMGALRSLNNHPCKWE